MKWAELQLEQKKDMDAKIAIAIQVIQQAFSIAHRPALAFSGGKDSTVLLDMIRRFFPDHATSLITIYGNTGVEYPECVKFVRWLVKEWCLNFYEARPGHTNEVGLKYAGQRKIYEHLVETGRINQVLKPDGKLKSIAALEHACPELLPELERDHLTWPAGTMMSYWWCVDQYGWPLLGKSWSRLDARRINIDTFLSFSKSESQDPTLLAYYNILQQAKISQHCCQVLKKEPANRVQAELGIDLIFKGLMASESRSRAKNFLTRGYTFEGASRDYLHGAPFFHCQPLAVWTDEDIWSYIHRYQIPYSPLYDLTYIALDGSKQHIKRNGCLGCGTDFGFHNSHLFILRQTHRHAWQVIMRAGMGQEIRNLQRAKRQGQFALFDTVPTQELIEIQPCMFDDLDGLGGQLPLAELAYDPDSD